MVALPEGCFNAMPQNAKLRELSMIITCPFHEADAVPIFQQSGSGNRYNIAILPGRAAP